MRLTGICMLALLAFLLAGCGGSSSGGGGGGGGGARIGRGVDQPTGTTTTVSFQNGVSGYSGQSDYTDPVLAGDLITSEISGGTILDVALLQFDLTASGIPAGATVTAASVVLTVYRENGGGQASDFLELRRVTEAWTGSGTKTYLMPPNPADGSLAIGALSGGLNVLPVPLPIEIDLNIPLVQSWLDTPATNTGIAVVPIDTSNGMELHFFADTEATISYRPKINITYTTDTNLVPTASVSSDVPSGDVPLTVNFTGGGSDPDGALAAFRYDFDDGNTAATQDAVHTFTEPGTYFVNYTVADNGGKMHTDIIEITVNDTAVPPDYGTIGYHPYSFPLKDSAESCAPGMLRPLPSSRRHILQWADQLDGASPAQEAFVARNIIGTQKISQNDIEGFRDRNPDFYVLQYHLAYGLTRSGDWIDKNSYGPEKDKFDPWMGAKGFGGTQRTNLFIRSSLSTFDSSSDSPDWDTLYGQAGLFDGALRYAADYYFVNLGYDPGGGPLWSRYVAEETIRRMQMNDAGYNFDGTFFDTSSHPGSNLVNCPGNWYEGVSGPHANLYAANLADFTTVWNTMAKAYYQYIRSSYSVGNRYLVLPNSNKMVDGTYTAAYLENTDGAWIEHFSVHGDATLATMGIGEWERSFGRICQYITGPKKVLCALPAFDHSAGGGDATRMFIIASFLLVKNDTSYISHNAGGYGAAPGSAPVRWFPEYEIEIGSYLDDCPNDIADLKVTGFPDLYARWYNGGIALVNTSQSVTYDFPLDRDYYQYQFSGGGWVALDGSKPGQSISTTGPISNTVSVPPNSGIILRVTPH